jgi:hypothetical protein
MGSLYPVPWRQMASGRTCGEIMKDYLETAKEEFKGVQYCVYCLDAKGDKRSCCDENHFINFEDFDEDTQQTIINDDYNFGFGVPV